MASRHRRMVERDDADALRLAAQVMKDAGETVGIEPLERFDMHVDVAPQGRLPFDFRDAVS